MLPGRRSCMAGSTARVQSQTPLTLTAITRSHSSSRMSWTPPRSKGTLRKIAALLLTPA